MARRLTFTNAAGFTRLCAEKIAGRKLSLLQLTRELGNVSKACRIVGYSRQQFYEIR